MKKKFSQLLYKFFIPAFACTFSACNDYLDEMPSKTTSLVVTTTAQLDALLNNYSSFYSEGNRNAIYSIDDYYLTKQIYDVRPGTFSSMATIEFQLWDINFLPDDTREVFWSGEFRK